VGAFYFMTTEHYDGLDWEIDDFPIGSSTPDDLFELSYRATTTCENGHTIEGTANFWSHNEDMANAWLNDIDYTSCEECEEEDDFEDDDF